MTSLTEKTQSEPPLETDAAILVLEAHTLRDLEIFDSASGGETVFEFCDRTKTDGGSKRLRQRMERPWADVGRIRATQESLSLISTHRQAFTKLPSFITRHVDSYEHEILLMVTQTSSVGFGIDALLLWANEDNHYHGIVRGVQYACSLIRALREFVGQAALAAPSGEIAPLFEEMRTLLARPRIVEVPDDELQGGWAWKILRLDQLFRLHEKATMVRLLKLIYEMDALVAMADTTDEHGFTLPSVMEGPLHVTAEGLVHPFVENPVANSVELDQQHRLLFLTGPNMAGKTTYLRAFATALYFGHLGMGVPATSFAFSPVERLFTSFTLSDDLRAGISYFRAEALRIKAVAEALAQGCRVVAVMDEPFKGTNVKDAFDASLAILERFATRENCLFMYSSHLIELDEQLTDTGQISRGYFQAEEGDGRLRFDYKLRPGVSSQRLGVRVLREEGIFELLDRHDVDEE
jgi:DNA mismatch repair protein MutS